MGRLVASRGVADLLSENHGFSAFVDQSLRQYVQRDWGDTCAADWEANNEALIHGERILAEYRDPEHPDWRIWIITEWDRSVTTVLFPEEY